MVSYRARVSPHFYPSKRVLYAMRRHLTFLLLVASFGPLYAFSIEPESSAAELPEGARLFSVHCGRCHGMEGKGGTGPSLVSPRLRRAPNLERLQYVIRNGIPWTGMPRNWMLMEKEVGLVAAFVLSLGRQSADAITGDPEQGRSVYQRAQCSNCHILDGEGEGIGPQLSSVGALRGVEHLRQIILHPESHTPIDPDGFRLNLAVRVVTASGEEIVGRRVNEDSFTIQLRDQQNRYYSFRKTEVQAIWREPETRLMPSFEGVFSDKEIEDLVAYLASHGAEE